MRKRVGVNNPWEKMTPAEHYRRISTSANREAWDHLAVLVYKTLVNNCVKLGIVGVSYEDQVQQTLLHILDKLRTKALKEIDPKRFYGLLKILVVNCLIDTLRKENVDLPPALDEEGKSKDKKKPRKANASMNAVGLEDVEAILASSDNVERSVELRFLKKKIWELLLDEPGIPERERRALDMSWKMDNGYLPISNNTELAQRLSLEFGEAVSYDQAAAMIHNAKKRLSEIAREKWRVVAK